MEPYALPTRPSPTANDDAWDWVEEENKALYAKESFQALRGSLLDDEKVQTHGGRYKKIADEADLRRKTGIGGKVD